MGPLRQSATRRREGLRWPLFGHVALLLGVSLMLLIGSGLVLWTALGRPRLAGGSAWTVTNTFDAVKILLAVVAGIGGVIALTVAYRRQHLSESAERRENTKLFNDRFAKAAELMGSDKAAVRLAGIYAVAALADDWRDGRQTCIDVLCAYLRMPYKSPIQLPTSQKAVSGNPTPESLESKLKPNSGPDSRDTARLNPHEEQQVRHTVIRVIAEHLRLAAAQPSSWQGFDFDFSGAVFDGGDFEQTTFSAGKVSFQDASFCAGTAFFHGAHFSGANVFF